MEEYKFTDLAAGATHSKNFSVTVRDRPAPRSLLPIVVTTTYPTTIVVTAEMTEEEVFDTTMAAAFTEYEEITTETDNYNEEITMVYKENLIALHVEEGKSDEVLFLKIFYNFLTHYF